MDEFFGAHIDAITGGDMTDYSVVPVAPATGGSMFDGLGDVLKDVGIFWAKSAIDAEYNEPTRLAERQMMMQAKGGGLQPAGTVNTGKSLLVPGLIALGAIVLVVLVVKK